MPVSPQDFELYSRMTGAPMPSDAMSRMQMAPDVYNFTKNFARKPNLFEKTGNLVKNIGKGAVMALGAPLVAASEAENARMQEQLRNQTRVTGDSEVERQKSPAEIIEDKRMARLEKTYEKKQEERDDKQEKAMALLKAKKGDLVDTPEIKEVQQTTTADSYGQDFVPNQTSSSIVNRKMEQGSQIADSTPNIAEVLSESQDSIPVDESFPVGDARRNMRPVEEIERNLQEDMETASLTRIGGPEGGVGKNQLAKFLSQKGLDQALLGAIGERMIPEPRIGDSSPLLDHPDVIGGEDDASLPGETNTSPTQDLSSFHKEMRKMNAMERNKQIIDEIVKKIPSPSEKQVGRSPNELAGKDQATFEALTGDPSQQQLIDASKARSRVEQKTAAQQRKSGIQSRMTDKFYPSDVARTDIQVGGMVDRKTGLGKSVGISYTPMNGDTKVGFNIMSDPTKPTEVSTFDFVAPPDTMQSLESREEDSLGTKSFGKLFNIARQKKQGFSGLEM